MSSSEKKKARVGVRKGRQWACPRFAYVICVQIQFLTRVLFFPPSHYCRTEAGIKHKQPCPVCPDSFIEYPVTRCYLSIPSVVDCSRWGMFRQMEIAFGGLSNDLAGHYRTTFLFYIQHNFPFPLWIAEDTTRTTGDRPCDCWWQRNTLSWREEEYSFCLGHFKLEIKVVFDRVCFSTQALRPFFGHFPVCTMSLTVITVYFHLSNGADISVLDPSACFYGPARGPFRFVVFYFAKAPP